MAPLVRGADPDDPVAFRRAARRLGCEVRPVGIVLALARSACDLLPGHRSRGDRGPPDLVLFAGPRQDREEPASLGGDVLHVVARRQLAVGRVEEVGRAEHGDQLVPGGDVGGRVLGRAVSQAMGDRHRAVRGDREDLDELLQVPAMILREPPLRDRRGHAGARRAVRVPVGAVEGDRGGVVVQLADVDPMAADRPEAEGGEQARAVRGEQLVEGSSHPVVVEQPRHH